VIKDPTITNPVTYLDFNTPLAGSQGHADTIYFDPNSAFHLVLHTLLLHKLSAFGLSGGYVNWSCSFLSNRQSQVRISGILPTPFVVLSGVPQGSVLEPLLFNISINDLCNVINYSKYFIFVDDQNLVSLNHPSTKIYHNLTLILYEVYTLLNFRKLNISKTRLISFSRETNTLIYDYKLRQYSIIRTNSVEDLEVFTDSKLRTHSHADYLFSQCTELLGLVRISIFSFSLISSAHIMLHFTLVRSKPEYASVVWNSIMNTDANKL
jgi:hypothetical protein